MEETIRNVENISPDKTKTKLNTLDFIVESMRDIIFDTQYLAILKETILKLTNGQIEQNDLKKLIIEHGVSSVEDIKDLIELYTETEIKRVIKSVETQKDKIKKYNQLLSKIAPRVEKIYNKLSL
ncbi:hypothetical protein ES703_30166 [subsurface metagenome]|uniref:Uncharacterized protein n=1 Tax=marine sediment metagenome TaxID=412755 RepID=X1A7Y5_9ZZZZ